MIGLGLGLGMEREDNTGMVGGDACEMDVKGVVKQQASNNNRDIVVVNIFCQRRTNRQERKEKIGKIRLNAK